MDPLFQYFYDMVRIIHFFQQEQTPPLVYILENTYLGNKCTTTIAKPASKFKRFWAFRS